MITFKHSCMVPYSICIIYCTAFNHTKWRRLQSIVWSRPLSLITSPPSWRRPNITHSLLQSFYFSFLLDTKESDTRKDKSCYSTTTTSTIFINYYSRSRRWWLNPPLTQLRASLMEFGWSHAQCTCERKIWESSIIAVNSLLLWSPYPNSATGTSKKSENHSCVSHLSDIHKWTNFSFVQGAEFFLTFWCHF